MTSFFWLGLAVLVVAIAAVTGFKPRKTRHVAHTQLMGGARIVLVLLVVVFAYLAWIGRTGG
ncbi:MAG: hypothetical protein ABI634_03620 [Acidobacteriota bacterium]